jgi:acetyl esterase/lipase
MASEQAQAITRRMAALQAEIMGSGVRPSLAEQRAAVDSFGDHGTEPPGVEVTRVELPRCTALWHVPAEVTGEAALVHFHGGGLAMGSAHGWRQLAGHLAVAAGAPVLNVDFRRAPEDPYPAGPQDARDAFAWVLGRGHRPGAVFLGGDSAGSALALGTAQALRDAGEPGPAGCYLLSPWVDLTLTNPSLSGNQGSDVLTTREALEMMRGFYAGAHDAADPRISPGLGELAGLPPLRIEASRDEILLDDATALAERARRAGVDVELVLWDGVPHVHQLFVGHLPEADDSVRGVGRWVRSRAGTAHAGGGRP